MRAAQTAHDGWSYPIFDAAAVGLRRVSPKVLGDEVGLGTFAGQSSLSRNGYAQLVALTLESPLILHVKTSVIMADLMGHGQGNILFVVKKLSHGSDGPARHDLADEDYAAAPFRIFAAAGIEAQIYFVEVAMEGPGNSPDFGVEKAESDQADETLVLERVEFGPSGHEPPQEVGVNGVVQQGEFAPLRRQEHGLFAASQAFRPLGEKCRL